MNIETKFDIDQEVTGDGGNVCNESIGTIFSCHARVGCRGEGTVIEYVVNWGDLSSMEMISEDDLREVTDSHPVKIKERLAEIENEIEDIRIEAKWINNPSHYIGNLEYEREALEHKLEAA